MTKHATDASLERSEVCKLHGSTVVDNTVLINRNHDHVSNMFSKKKLDILLRNVKNNNALM